MQWSDGAKKKHKNGYISKGVVERGQGKENAIHLRVVEEKLKYYGKRLWKPNLLD